MDELEELAGCDPGVFREMRIEEFRQDGVYTSLADKPQSLPDPRTFEVDVRVNEGILFALGAVEAVFVVDAPFERLQVAEAGTVATLL